MGMTLVANEVFNVGEKLSFGAFLLGMPSASPEQIYMYTGG